MARWARLKEMISPTPKPEPVVITKTIEVPVNVPAPTPEPVAPTIIVQPAAAAGGAVGMIALALGAYLLLSRSK
jgi:hypothetical protein